MSVGVLFAGTMLVCCLAFLGIHGIRKSGYVKSCPVE